MFGSIDLFIDICCQLALHSLTSCCCCVLGLKLEKLNAEITRCQETASKIIIVSSGGDLVLLLLLLLP